MTQLRTEDLLIPSGAGERTGTHLDIKVRSGRLGGDFSLMEGAIRPRELLTPHTHRHEDQAVIVLTGTLVFEVGGRDGLVFEAPAGSYVIKPRGVAHGFWNPTGEPARYVELSGRDGFERFVDSTTRKGAARASIDAGRDFDIEFHSERIPELMLRHQLRRIASVEMPWDRINQGPLEEVIARLRGLVSPR